MTSFVKGTKNLNEFILHNSVRITPGDCLSILRSWKEIFFVIILHSSVSPKVFSGIYICSYNPSSEVLLPRDVRMPVNANPGLSLS